MNIDTKRIDSFLSAHREGRLIRHAWTRSENGRHLVCILAALSPEAGAAQDASACPADVVWPWLADLMPWIGDAGTDAAWPGHVARLVAIVPNLPRLDDAAGRRLEWACKAAALREAVQAAGSDGVVSCVLAICEQGAVGNEPDAEVVATASAASAAEAAWWATAEAARRAAWWASARAQAEAAWRAAWWAASARSAAEASWWATGRAARAESGDRIIRDILDAFEAEVARTWVHADPTP